MWFSGVVEFLKVMFIGSRADKWGVDEIKDKSTRELFIKLKEEVEKTKGFRLTVKPYQEGEKNRGFAITYWIYIDVPAKVVGLLSSTVFLRAKQLVGEKLGASLGMVFEDNGNPRLLIMVPDRSLTGRTFEDWKTNCVFFLRNYLAA